MIEKGEKTVGIQKSIKWTILLAIAVLVLWRVMIVREEWKKMRYDMKGTQTRQLEVQRFAGCQDQSMIDTLSDKEFSELWLTESRAYDFNYDDVLDEMKQRCPLGLDYSDDAIEKHWTLYHETNKYPDTNQIEATKISIERGKSIRNYKLKFINKEFSVFQNE